MSELYVSGSIKFDHEHIPANELVYRLKYAAFNAIFFGIFNPVIVRLNVLKVTQFNVVKIEKTV